MARRRNVLDGHSPEWRCRWSFNPNQEAYSELEELRAIGVSELEYQFGRTAGGSFFMNQTWLIPVKGQVVSVEWLQKVRDLCESMGPQLLEETIWVASPGNGDSDIDYRDVRSGGDLLLGVSLRFAKETHLHVCPYAPAATAEVTPAGA
jgi:hypothetical protein